MEKSILRTPVFILAGGLGTRISEETGLKPKPMIEIGELPILLHIMRWYYQFGFNDFVICAGYKSWEIKQFFLNYSYRCHDLDVDHRQSQEASPRTIGGNGAQEKWRVRVIDTGPETMTGARVARAFDAATRDGSFENFALTYGDGLCDVDLAREFFYHIEHGKIGTVLGVKNLARYGELDLRDGSNVDGFLEKPENRQGFINGGFFLFKKEFRNYLTTDEGLILEREPLANLAKDAQLQAFKHDGFWHAMDTLRDKNHLQKMWEENKAPWRTKK